MKISTAYPPICMCVCSSSVNLLKTTFFYIINTRFAFDSSTMTPSSSLFSLFWWFFLWKSKGENQTHLHSRLKSLSPALEGPFFWRRHFVWSSTKIYYILPFFSPRPKIWPWIQAQNELKTNLFNYISTTKKNAIKLLIFRAFYFLLRKENCYAHLSMAVTRK